MSSHQRNLFAHYARLLARWPIDRLRPESLQFQRLLQHRIRNPNEQINSEKDVNAAYLLLDDSFQKKYPLSQKMMKPASQPEHYENLAKELEEAPDRTWMARVVRRIKGMVRFR